MPVDQHQTSAFALAQRLQQIKQIAGDDEEDTALLREMATRAHRYLESFNWCAAVVDGWFAQGVGGIFALFLFQMVPAHADVDEWLWVMNGDLPSVYLAFQDAPSEGDAFDEYVEGMLRWASHVRSGEIENAEGIPPIDAPATIEFADDVQRRAESLRRILGPLFT